MGPAVESMYRLVLWLVPTVEKFSRRQKFLLGDRLQATVLDVLERLVEATYTRTAAGICWRRISGSRSCGSCADWRRTSGTWTSAATSTRRDRSTRPGG